MPMAMGACGDDQEAASPPVPFGGGPGDVLGAVREGRGTTPLQNSIRRKLSLASSVEESFTV